MRTYRGSCHCGRVTFEVETDLESVGACNCSICRRKGVLMQRVPPERFRLLTGADALTLYQFNTGTARHTFCKVCGIHPFHHPRAAPEMIAVNVRCLEADDLVVEDLHPRVFDGRNWEQARQKLREADPNVDSRPLPTTGKP